MAIARHLEIAAQLLKELTFRLVIGCRTRPSSTPSVAGSTDLVGGEPLPAEVWEAIVGARKRGLVGSSRRRRRASRCRVTIHRDGENS